MIASMCIPYVLHESHTLNHLQSRDHGLDHWWRVWKNAVFLGGPSTGADMEVVAMYCLFHDSMRVNDEKDPGHGIRGFRLWERYKALDTHVDRIFTHRQEELLFEACAEHSEGELTTDPTIAVCWDSDRLDLHRKGLWPDARFMSSQEARAMTMTRVIP